MNHLLCLDGALTCYALEHSYSASQLESLNTTTPPLFYSWSDWDGACTKRSVLSRVGLHIRNHDLPRCCCIRPSRSKRPLLLITAARWRSVSLTQALASLSSSEISCSTLSVRSAHVLCMCAVLHSQGIDCADERQYCLILPKPQFASDCMMRLNLT